MADETKRVHVMMGPYRDNHLTMSAADADAAINGHWAVDPSITIDPDDQHPPLDDAARQAALDAAHAWAKTTWEAAQAVVPPEPPPPEGGATRKRAMKADEGDEYKTR